MSASVIKVQCPQCSHQWEQRVDVASKAKQLADSKKGANDGRQAKGRKRAAV